VEIWVGKHNIQDYGLIYFRRPSGCYLDLFKTVAAFCERQKINYINKAWGNNQIGDKLYDLVRLAWEGLPVMPTVACWPKVFKNAIVYPVIVKTLDGLGGEGVYLLENQEQVEALPNRMYLFQKFYENDGDYRLVVLGGKVEVVELRTRVKDKYRNNAHLGGREVFLDLEKVPQKLIEIAEAASKVLNLQLSGVDILVEQKTDKVWILEVNKRPGFTSVADGSPELPAVVEYFKKLLV
jgi:glutathione synthase/RimK-type ligase-like ATP-grasp enzyme